MDLSSSNEVARRSVMIMADGKRADFDAVIAPDAFNREHADEPPACRVSGPAGFHASALWLRAAFADLSFEVQNVVAENDLVVLDVTMRGRHVGDFVLYDAAGRVDRAYAPTGRSFDVAQTHWYRMSDGLVAEHWAVRDDLGQSLQLGWVPPTPLYLWQSSRAARRARRGRAGA